MSFKYLDPINLAKLGNLRIKAKYVVEGFVSGMHRSPYRGHSLEFAQHREYSPGDELRHIDWKVYGRTDKFFVKQYQEETNLRAYILLDISRSMTYKYGKTLDKLTYGIHLAAILSYLLLHQDDSVGLAVFDNEVRNFIPSRAHMGHFSIIAEALEKITPGKDTKIASVSDSFSKYLKRRGLIIFISDLLDEPSEVIKTLKNFRYKHHDVIVLQVISNAEREFPFEGSSLFESLEGTDLKVYSEPELIQAEYRRLFNEFIEQYKIGFRQAGIDYCLLSTDMPFELGIRSFISNRNVA
jgi:uncharacterized protein (DUF58 family)